MIDSSQCVPAEPVRVMHVVYALRPGGMELGVVKLVNGLNPGRVRSTICSTKPAGELKQLLAPDVALFELQRRDGNDPRLIRDLYRLFRREQPDIVHTHAWGTLIEGLVAARLARVPVVIHGEHGTLQLRVHQRWVQRRAWASADQLLSVSSRLAERIAHETRFPLSRIRTIRNGVDLSRFGHISREAARATLGIGGDSSVAVAVGRLVPVKDHMMLLEAIALLRRDDVDVTLALVGDGPLKGALLERASALGIDNSVRFFGYRDDTHVVLAAADVFVLSSTSEGLSNTILEAMAARLPVVATRVGGADELVQDGVTGLLVPPRSPQEFAAAVATVLRDAQQRRSMGSAGRARVEAGFSLTDMVRRYEAMYADLAASRGRAARLRRTAVDAHVNRSEVA